MPPIGSLRDRVQLWRKDMSAEAEGGHGVSHTMLASVWARVRALSGRFGSEADGRTAGISHSVVMRFRANIGVGDRIIYRGVALEIISAEDLNGRRAYLSCSCAATEVIG